MLYYLIGPNGGTNLMKRDGGALFYLDQKSGEWVLDGSLIEKFYSAAADEITEAEAKAKYSTWTNKPWKP